MTACAGVGEMQEAEELLDAMQEAGIKTDIRAYNILLTGYSRYRFFSSFYAFGSHTGRIQEGSRRSANFVPQGGAACQICMHG